jgi:hypothetical protein
VGVAQVVGPADDVGDPHPEVVHHAGELVGGLPVPPEDHEVLDLIPVEMHGTVNVVMEGDRLIVRHLEAEREGLSRLGHAP